MIKYIVEPKVVDHPQAVFPDVRTAKPGEKPEFWGVYMVIDGGLPEHVEDFHTEELANRFANRLNKVSENLGGDWRYQERNNNT